MSHRKWTPEEDELLRQIYGSAMTEREAADYFGRSLMGVYMRATRLGLRDKPQYGERNPTWVVIQRVCADGVPRTVSAIATLVGITAEGVRYHLKNQREAGRAHVACYLEVGGASRAHWLPLPGVDAEPPEWKTPESLRIDRSTRRAERRSLVPAATRPSDFIPQQHEISRALFGMGAPA